VNHIVASVHFFMQAYTDAANLVFCHCVILAS